MHNTFTFLFLWMLSAVPAWAQQAAGRPNILWIVSEDNSPMLGCYGDKFATTPHLDAFARQAVLFENAFTTAPACAPSRAALITGMFASSLGTEQMRSKYPIPAFIKFYTRYLRTAGYYTSNNAKEDYNTVGQPEAWDESSSTATYKNRKQGQPFFAVFNLGVTHESRIHGGKAALKHDPEKAPIPPYHPRTPEMKHDWALYYDRIETMDAQVGKLLQELEAAGLAANTIVFYFSDHGGVLARSKRFMYDSGLRVPLIIRFPARYAALAPGQAGTKTDRLVSFVDFAPSVLSLAGVKIPAHMEGKPFLGAQQAPEREYAYSYRGRIDESLEFVRSIRNKKYRYIRNFMPHKIYGQHNEYLWQARSIVSWENSYQAGTLNAVQAAFWKEKPSEELYEVATDPYNVHNLAGKKEYQAVLEKMRSDNRAIMLQTKDTGFIPESMKATISQQGTSYDFARTPQYPLNRILETAELATSRDGRHLNDLKARLSDKNPIVRYWAATGCVVLGKQAQATRPGLVPLLQDPEPAVRIAAAEALYGLGEQAAVVPVLTRILQADNQLARVEALTVLEKMGPAAKPASASLKNMIALRAGKGKRKQAQPLWKADHDVKIATRILAGFGE